jgi:uncharacterized membrane protein YidH (DUF202 family)
MASEPEPTDRGLAGERTALAWNRSGLAVVVCVAVVLRHLWPLDDVDEDVALCLTAAAAVVWVMALLVLTHSRGSRGEYVPGGTRIFGLMTAGTVILAVAGFVLAFIAPP